MSVRNEPTSSRSEVVVVNSGLGFPQTGSWDWVSLGKTVTTFSVNALARYCGAKVNPYTVVVGRAMCKVFQLAPAGRRNMEKALASLKSVSSINSALYFGFGVQSPLHLLAETEEGTCCLAICAALRECYHENVAVEVLLELARSFTAVPGEYMPSSLEWKALLQLCSGALAQTSISIRAEHFMSLFRETKTMYCVVSTLHRPCSKPENIAKALLGVAKLSNKELDSITLVGNADAGWVAAIAEWLFDISVIIFHRDGTVLYSNRDSQNSFQLSIVFESDPKPQTALSISERTYVLEDARLLFEREIREDECCVSGRLEWEKALTGAYPQGFTILLENAYRPFAVILGSAASIFEAIAEDNPQVPVYFCRQWDAYSTSAYGMGFVENALAWFPELAPLRKYIEQACKNDYKTSVENFNNAVDLLKSRCQCIACLDSWRRNSYTSRCLFVLAQTIIRMALALAHVDPMSKDLRPRRAGLDLAYDDQYHRYIKSGVDHQTAGHISHCLTYNAFDLGPKRRMRLAFQLFAGIEIRSPELQDISAYSKNGICLFSNIQGARLSGLCILTPWVSNPVHPAALCILSMHRCKQDA